jgi:diguanylate cyclase (GGDEF)-like protein
VSSLEFFAEAPDTDGEILHLSPANRFRGARAEPPPPVDGIIGTARSAWTGSGDGDYRVIPHWPGSGPAFEPAGHPALVVPLFAPDRWVATGIAVLHLYGLNDVSHADMGQIVHQMVMPLQVAVERECLYRALDLERQAFYQQSIRDPLTGLYTRFYLQDNLKRVLDLNDRDASVPVGVLMLDLDHFKQINDRFGHAAGDTVLRRIGETVLGGVRAADIPVRLGGEEFAVFCLGLDQTSLFELGERLRAAIEALEWDALLAGGSVTASLGLAMRRPGETGDGLLERADQALYSAKNGGRNRLVMAP